MQPITSTSNSKVKAARKLQRKRHRDQSNLCLLEGVRLVVDAWQAGAAFERVFITQAAVETSQPGQDAALARPVAQMTEAGVDLLWVSDEVLATLCETQTPQGIVAVVRQNQMEIPSPLSLVLVLDGVGDPGNAGTLLRSAGAAGVDLVIFGPESVDAYNDKVLRAGMGAHFRLPLRSVKRWEEVQRLVGSLPLFVADAEGDLLYDQADWRSPAGLVVGSEATGPSAEALAQGQTVAIPMRGETESLNVATAGSVILFEAARQRRRS